MSSVPTIKRQDPSPWLGAVLLPELGYLLCAPGGVSEVGSVEGRKPAQLQQVHRGWSRIAPQGFRFSHSFQRPSGR